MIEKKKQMWTFHKHISQGTEIETCVLIFWSISTELTNTCVLAAKILFWKEKGVKLNGPSRIKMIDFN